MKAYQINYINNGNCMWLGFANSKEQAVEKFKLYVGYYTITDIIEQDEAPCCKEYTKTHTSGGKRSHPGKKKKSIN